AGLAVVAQEAQPLRGVRVPADDHAPVAVRAQVLGGIEAERAVVPHRSRFAAFAGRAVRLRAVFDNREPARGGHLQDRAHVRALALEALHRGSQDEPAAVEHRADRRVYLVLDGQVLLFQAVGWNAHLVGTRISVGREGEPARAPVIRYSRPYP